MDLLKKEMERKKQAMALAKKEMGGTSRFVKAGDLRRRQEEEEERMRNKRSRDNNDNLVLPTKDKEDGKSPTTNKYKMKEKASDPIVSSSPKTKKPKRQLSASEITKRLRDLGLPILLFGEKLEGRVDRLETALEQQKSQSKTVAEMDEFRLGQGHSIRNPFLENKKGEPEDATTTTETAAEVAKKKQQEKEEEEEDTSDDPPKRIYRYFKGLLKQWEDDLALRPDASKRTVAGKNETKTLKQCKDYIRPLFKLCKTRKLEEGLMTHLLHIVNYCQEGDFVKAHDSYLDVAIGRAAWPIGVTMVGIHARSGRAKIESGKVAHVMNSELQRKYLTSVKRLMSYAQKKATHVDPSRKVMN